jgi:hypothetical protein
MRNDGDIYENKTGGLIGLKGTLFHLFYLLLLFYGNRYQGRTPPEEKQG